MPLFLLQGSCTLAGIAVYWYTGWNNGSFVSALYQEEYDYDYRIYRLRYYG